MKPHFKGRDLLFVLYIWYNCGAMAGIYGAKKDMVGKMSSTDSHLGMIMMQSLQPWVFFLMRQFYTSIPDELCEAARIDGLTEWNLFPGGSSIG